MVDRRWRIGRVAALMGLVGLLAYGTFAVLDALGLRGRIRLFAFFLLAAGVVAGMFFATAWVVLDGEE
ncbi:hypothetical protein BRD00_08170 [Halobacteriales archaeon QS_8_69_26]|nr:MAG: hypothetical protein BRD00_08170 [Halobacteriales archaeon QS_8_69_26]